MLEVYEDFFTKFRKSFHFDNIFSQKLKKTISRQKNRETLFTFYLRNTERIPFHFILTNIFFRENVFQNQK